MVVKRQMTTNLAIDLMDFYLQLKNYPSLYSAQGMKVSAWQGTNHVSSKIETSRNKKQNCFIFFKSGTLFKYQSRKDEGFADAGRLDSLVRKIWFEDSASLKLQSGDAAFT